MDDEPLASVEWDKLAGVWRVVDCYIVPGLQLEASTIRDLVEKLEAAASRQRMH